MQEYGGTRLRSLIINTQVLYLKLKYVEFPVMVSSATTDNGHLLFCCVIPSKWSIHQ